jgi:hypothetical protein
MLTIGQRKQFIVAQHTIQVLDPFRIDIAIKDNPVSLTAFTTDVIDNLARDVGEQSVVPSTRRGIERGSVEEVARLLE